jgi:hypothetical protein
VEIENTFLTPHIHLSSARNPDSPSSQNVYLQCASVGLATFVRGSLDKDALALAMAKGNEVEG